MIELAEIILSDDEADDEYVRVKQDAFFRAAERRGYSRVVLSELTGINTDTLATYCTTPSRKASIMSLGKLRRLVATVPPEISSILFDATGVHLLADNPQPATLMQIGARCAGVASQIMTAAIDGHIDHRESAQIRDSLTILIGEAEGQVRS